MAQIRRPSSSTSQPAAEKAAKRSRAVSTKVTRKVAKKADKLGPALSSKGSISLRIETDTRRLIDEAASASGKTRTEFMVESARQQAIDVLLDRRLFELGAAQFDAFVQALDKAPAPGPKLKALMRRVPAWQK